MSCVTEPTELRLSLSGPPSPPSSPSSSTDVNVARARHRLLSATNLSIPRCRRDTAPLQSSFLAPDRTAWRVQDGAAGGRGGGSCERRKTNRTAKGREELVNQRAVGRSGWWTCFALAALALLISPFGVLYLLFTSLRCTFPRWSLASVPSMCLIDGPVRVH